MDALTVNNNWNRLSSLFSDRESDTKTSSKKRKHKFNMTLTPELEARLAEVEKNCREGNCITLRSPEDVDKYFDSL